MSFAMNSPFLHECLPEESVEIAGCIGTVISALDEDESTTRQSSYDSPEHLEYASAVHIGHDSDEKNEFSSAVSICCHSYLTMPLSVDPNLGYMKYLESVSRTSLLLQWKESTKMLQSETLGATDYLSIMEDSLLVFGGIDPLNATNYVVGGSFFRLKCKEGLWQLCGTMPEPRSYHSAARIGTNILITGGYNPFLRISGEIVSTATTFSLCLKSGLWRECANMNHARACHAMVVLQSKFYVFGGRDNNGRILSSVEFYDMDEDMWTIISNMPEPRMGLAAVNFLGSAWIIGGVTPKGDFGDQYFSVLCAVNSFHPKSNSWSDQESISEPKTYCQAAVLENDIYVFGGAVSRNYKGKMKLASTALVEVYRSSTKKWLHFDSLSRPKHAVGVAMGCCKTYIIGGMKSSDGTACNDVDLLDCTCGLITEEKPFPFHITGCSAVYLPTANTDDMKSDVFLPQEYTDSRTQSKISNFLEHLPKSYIEPCEKHLKLPKYEQKSPFKIRDASDTAFLEKPLITSKSMIPIKVMDENSSCHHKIGEKTEDTFFSFFDKILDKDRNLKYKTFDEDLKLKDKTFTFPVFDHEKESHLSCNLGHTISDSKFDWSYKNPETGFSSKKLETDWSYEKPEIDWSKFNMKRNLNVPDITKEFPAFCKIGEEVQLPFSNKCQTKFWEKDSAKDIQNNRKSTGIEYDSKQYAVQDEFQKFHESTDLVPTADVRNLFSFEIPGMVKKSVDSFSQLYASGIFKKHSKKDSREQLAKLRNKQKSRIRNHRKYCKSCSKKISNTGMDYTKSHSFSEGIKIQDHEKVSGSPAEYSFCKLNIDPNVGTVLAPLDETHTDVKNAASGQECGYQEEESHGQVSAFSQKFPSCRFLRDLTIPAILTFGGLDPCNPCHNSAGQTMFLYYPLRNCWKFVGLMPLSRNYHGTVFCNQCIFIIGGYDPMKIENGEMLATNSLLVLDLQVKRWQKRRSMQHSRSCLGAVVIDGYIYALGGRNSLGRILDSVEAYNIKEDQWTACHRMPYPVMGAAVSVVQGLICVIGGVTVTSQTQSITSDVLFYNPKDDSWCYGPPMKAPVAYSGISYDCNRVWLFGGLMTSGQTLYSIGNIMNLNMVNREWHESSNLTTPRHAAISLNIGSCTFIIGGMNCKEKETSPVDKNEVFITEKQLTRSIASLPYCLSGMSGVVISPEAGFVYSSDNIDSMLKKSVDKIC